MAEVDRVELVRGLYEDFPEDMVTSLADDDEVDTYRARYAQVISEDFSIRLLGPPGSGFDERSEGFDGMIAAWREWTAPFQRHELEPEEYLDGREAVLVLVTQRAFLTGSESAVETQVAAVYHFRGGRIVSIEFHLDRDRARESAGIPSRRLDRDRSGA